MPSATAFTDPTSATPTAPAGERRRTMRQGMLEVIACSLLVTTLAAVLAVIAAWAMQDVEWSYAFVITRWLLVAVLLVTPLVHQASSRLGASWRLPWVLQTPATGLLLTIESIGFDIASARLGG